MKLVDPTHPVLWQVAAPVIDVASQVRPHLEEMQKILRALGGRGMAAPQVALPLRFFLMRLGRNPDPTLPARVCVNPWVIGQCGEDVEIRREGCMTWPDRYTEKARPRKILAGWFDLFGGEQSQYLHGVDARCFLHELDHLNGICLFPRPEVSGAYE